MPMFYGQIMMQGYLEDPAISFCAIGDAKMDDVPLQVTNFGQGKQIDELLSKMYLEGGGGGNQHESYELAAWFYLHCAELKNPNNPFFFVTGDEYFFPDLLGAHIKQYTDHDGENMKSQLIWQDLLKKFNVFHLHKPYDDHKLDEQIIQQWKNSIGKERVLLMKTPKACVDVMLGAIAITSGIRTLETYIQDMVQRGQTQDRIDEVKTALSSYSEYLQSKKKEFVKKIPQNEHSQNMQQQALRLEEEVKSIQLNQLKDQNLQQVSQQQQQSSQQQQQQQQQQYTQLLENQIIQLARQTIMIQSSLLDNKELKDRKAQMEKIKKFYNDKIPDDFYCPITQEIFVDPVMAEDGNTYERVAIEAWFQKHDTSPLTNQQLTSKHLVQNLTVKKLVQDFIRSKEELLEKK
eukprot:TRINITY_DN67_c0_g4_i1.p1 TRINITY_DN67_c0_g4~~TRINITY_DN67_c0_g4_i1.p1  ORF type:complete len:405 (-),score=83.82 TRINITY_DN67_c0_g4_i1:155-1369(-)